MNPNIHVNRLYEADEEWDSWKYPILSQSEPLWQPILSPPENPVTGLPEASAPALSDDETNQFQSVSLTDTHYSPPPSYEASCQSNYHQEPPVWVMPTSHWQHNPVVLEDDPYYRFPKLGWWSEKIDQGVYKAKRWWRILCYQLSGGRLYQNRNF